MYIALAVMSSARIFSQQTMLSLTLKILCSLRGLLLKRAMLTPGTSEHARSVTLDEDTMLA